MNVDAKKAEERISGCVAKERKRERERIPIGERCQEGKDRIERERERGKQKEEKEEEKHWGRSYESTKKAHRA